VEEDLLSIDASELVLYSIFYDKYTALAAILEAEYLSILYSMRGNSMRYLARLNYRVSPFTTLLYLSRNL